MGIEDIGQSLDTQVARVVLVRRPRFHGHLSDSVPHLVVQAKGQASPIFENRLRIGLRVPSQATKCIKVRHRQMTSEPSLVKSYVGDTGVASQLALEDLSGNNVADVGLLAIDTHIKV
ncbi:hypothetical protein HG531_001189 [Fusarium graminearum]|nr:hypothetical protein HG531_001189 [Fusarium graminearum]